MNTGTALDLAFLIILSLLPALFWSIFLLQKRLYKEPFAVLIFAFLLGGLATLPPLILRFLWPAIPLYLLPIGLLPVLTLIVGAALEEMSKHSGAMFAMHQDLRAMDERTDGIVYGIVVGLGFAFVENAVYLWTTYLSQGVTPTFWYIFAVRSVLTMVAHALFSGTFGYFYGISYIRPNTDYVRYSPLRLTLKSLFQSISLRNFFFVATLTMWMKRKDTIYNFNALEVLFEGYLVVIVLHAVFNFVLSLPTLQNMVLYILIPYLFLLGNILFIPFARKTS